MSVVQIRSKQQFEYINKLDVQNRYTLRYTFTACRGGKIAWAPYNLMAYIPVIY